MLAAHRRLHCSRPMMLPNAISILYQIEHCRLPPSRLPMSSNRICFNSHSFYVFPIEKSVASSQECFGGIALAEGGPVFRCEAACAYFLACIISLKRLAAISLALSQGRWLGPVQQDADQPLADHVGAGERL